MERYKLSEGLTTKVLEDNKFKINEEKSNEKLTVYSYDEKLTDATRLLVDISEKNGKFRFKQFKGVKVRFNATKEEVTLGKLVKKMPNSNWAINAGWNLRDFAQKGILTKKLSRKSTMKF